MSDYEKLLLDAIWFQAEKYLSHFGALRSHMLSSDEAGAAFGVVTFDVMLKAQTTQRGTLSGLKRLREQGKVLSYRSRKGGMYRWWPVGFTEAKKNGGGV